MKKKMIKKLAVLFGCLLLIACGLSRGLMTSPQPASDSEKTTAFSIKTTRKIPESADFGKYLAGTIARNNQDFSAINAYYQDVLKADPENTAVLEQLYLSHMLLNRFDELLPLIPLMDSQMQERLYTANALVVDSFRQKKYADVLEQLKKMSNDSVGQVLNPVLTAWAYMGLGESEKSLKSLKPLYKNEQLKTLGLYHEMMILMNLNRMESAQNVARVLFDGNPDSIPALIGMRQLYQKTGKWNRDNPVFVKYNQMVKKNPILMQTVFADSPALMVDTPQKGVAQLFYDFALSVADTKNGGEAALMFNSFALALNDDSDLVRSLQGELLESMELYQIANRVYAGIAHPSDMILFKQALNMIRLDDLAGAEKIMLDLTRQNKADPLLNSLLAGIYRDTNRPELALPYYTLAIDLLKQVDQPKALANVYFMRASAYEQMKKSNLAESDLLRSVTLDPDNATVLNYLGYTWLEQGKNMPKAIEYIEKAYQISPDEAHILDSVAWAHYKQKNYDKALELSERVSDLMPGSSVAADHLGDIYLALGRRREAGYQYKKALDLASDLTDEQLTAIRKKQNKLLKSE